MDTILKSGDNSTIDTFKAAFNATEFTYNDDFANTISQTFGYWQSLNWDPAVSDPTFFEYCGNITSDDVLFDNTKALASTVPSLIEAGGWGNLSSNLTNRMLNFIGWTTALYIDGCDATLDECYGNHNASHPKYTQKTIDNYGNLSWPYQYCTEWGFLQSGSTVPQNLPALISRLVTLEYNSLVRQQIQLVNLI